MTLLQGGRDKDGLNMFPDTFDAYKQVFGGIIIKANTNGHSMKVIVHHSEKEKELSLQAPMPAL